MEPLVRDVNLSQLLANGNQSTEDTYFSMHHTPSQLALTPHSLDFQNLYLPSQPFISHQLSLNILPLHLPFLPPKNQNATAPLYEAHNHGPIFGQISFQACGDTLLSLSINTTSKNHNHFSLEGYQHHLKNKSPSRPPQNMAKPCIIRP